MGSLPVPAYITIISVGLLVLMILFLASLAGLKRFTQMGLAMDISEQTQTPKKRPNKLLEGARTVLVTLLPLVVAVVFEITGSAILGSLVLIAFVAYLLTYYVFVSSRQAKDSVMPLRIEDWLVAVFPPILLLVYFFQIINTTTYLTSLLLCCSCWWGLSRHMKHRGLLFKS